MPKELHSQRVARAFGLSGVPATVIGTSPGLAITFLELELHRNGGGESHPMRTDDAFLLMHFAHPQENFRLHCENGERYATGILEKESCLLDLRAPFSLSWSCPLHALVLYIPRQVFFDGNELCVERHTLRCDLKMDDAVLASIMGCLGGSPLGRRNRGRDLFVRHVLLAACARLTQLCVIEVAEFHIAPRALTSEQQDSATSLMRDHMAGGLSMRVLAEACGMAHIEFVRAFKRSFGVSPRDWLTARRLERARELMSDHSLPLTEIASKVGFSDSSQFNRIFTRFTGCPPGAWRRESRGLKTRPFRVLPG